MFCARFGNDQAMQDRREDKMGHAGSAYAKATADKSRACLPELQRRQDQAMTICFPVKTLV
jgi:hypothetical protein